MALPNDIEWVLKQAPLTIEEINGKADEYFADLVLKYPNITQSVDKYPTLSGVYSAAYGELLQKYNSLKSYIETLK